MDFFYSPETGQTPRSHRIEISPFAATVRYKDAEEFILPLFDGEPGASIADPLFGTLFLMYSRFYGRVKGDSCLFYPTCSHYSQLAIRDYGLISGLWMTGGRLIRAHFNFDHFYPVVEAPEGVRWFDPPVHERFEHYPPDPKCKDPECSTINNSQD